MMYEIQIYQLKTTCIVFFFYKQSVKSKASWSIPNVVSVYALVLPPPPLPHL